MTFGSFATGIHEPCQVRNEAALSETSCVPEGSLDRANCIGNVCGRLFEAGRTVFYIIRKLCFLLYKNALQDAQFEAGDLIALQFRSDAISLQENYIVC